MIPPETKPADSPNVEGQVPRPDVAAKARAKPAGTGHSISIEGLNAYYGAHHTIKDLSIKFPANEATALIGPSGSGKSTVVRCINRMHEEIPGARAEGSIRLDETELYGDGVDVTAVRRLIGMVFQKPNPFPTMSIFDNVAAGLRLTGTKVAHLRDRVHESLHSVGLWDEVKDRLNEPGIGLSGGQQQRLCIARTIAIEPEVVLMDEPASALDPISTLKIEELVDELKSRYTIVIVTHNMQQATRCSDMTAFFYLGHLIEFDKTEKLFTNPVQKQTEDYISGRFG
jgi:phosphate transport system ATP-binding protein